MGIDIEKLKTALHRKIAVHEAAIADLQIKLKQIDGVEQLALEFESESGLPPITRASELVERYRAMKQKDACLAVLREAQRPMSASEVAQALTDGGYPFTAENRTNAVYASLNAMAHAEEIAASRNGTSTEFSIATSEH